MIHSDLKLTQSRRFHGTAVAQTLSQQKNVMDLYSYPVVRAQETAETVATLFELPARLLEGLARLDVDPASISISEFGQDCLRPVTFSNLFHLSDGTLQATENLFATDAHG